MFVKKKKIIIIVTLLGLVCFPFSPMAMATVAEGVLEHMITWQSSSLSPTALYKMEAVKTKRLVPLRGLFYYIGS